VNRACRQILYVDSVFRVHYLPFDRIARKAGFIILIARDLRHAGGIYDIARDNRLSLKQKRKRIMLLFAPGFLPQGEYFMPVFRGSYTTY